MALKRAVGSEWEENLSAESVEGASLPLQGVDDVHGGDGLPLGVLGVGDGIADDVLEEHLEDAAGLLVDQTGDALDAASAGQTADGGLGDALDVVTKDLPVTLGASLAESLASFASSRHDEIFASVISETNTPKIGFCGLFVPAGADLSESISSSHWLA